MIEMYRNGEATEREMTICLSPFFRALSASLKENDKQRNEGHIYILENSQGFIKIGRSKNPKLRIRTLETQGNIEIKRTYTSEKLDDCGHFERVMHRKFKNYLLKGEWFSAAFEDAKNEIEKLILASKQ